MLDCKFHQSDWHFHLLLCNISDLTSLTQVLCGTASRDLSPSLYSFSVSLCLCFNKKKNLPVCFVLFYWMNLYKGREIDNIALVKVTIYRYAMSIACQDNSTLAWMGHSINTPWGLPLTHSLLSPYLAWPLSHLQNQICLSLCLLAMPSLPV